MSDEDDSLREDIEEVCDYYWEDPDGKGFPDHNYYALAEYLLQDSSARTVTHYVRHLAYYPPELFDHEEGTDWELRDDAVETLEEFSSILPDTPKTYYTYLALKHYCRAMNESHLVEHLPEPRDVEKPESNPNTFRLERDEILSIMEAAGDDHQMQLAIACLFFGAMRTFELFHINPLWLDFDSSDMITVMIPAVFAKGKRKTDRKSETTYLPRWMESPLKDFIREQYNYGGSYDELEEELRDDDRPAQPRPFFDFTSGEEPFMPEDEDAEKPIPRINKERYRLRRRLTRLTKRALGDERDTNGNLKYEEVTPHCLRRSLIYDLYENATDGDINETSHAVRHGDPETTADYLKLDEEEKRDVFRRAGYDE